MVVDLKPTGVKTEDGKKKWADFVPVSIPETRKKKAALGCGTIFVLIALVGLCLLVLAVAGYFTADAIMAGGKTKEAEFYCDEPDCEDCYETKYMHGERTCERDDFDGQEQYQDWMDILQGRSVQCKEYIRKFNGVFTIEIEARCDHPKTYIVIDTNTGYSAVKAQLRNYDGYQCMLFDNEAMLKETLDQIEEFDYDDDEEDEYDLAISRITSSFYRYGEPVPQKDREYLGEEINTVCPMNELPFYYMVSGEDSFRSQVSDLMDAYDVTYDDVFYWFVDIYEALVEEDSVAMREVLQQYEEIAGFLPVGDYKDTSPTGVGWSLNVDRKSYYWYDWRVVETDLTFEHNDTLLPQ